MASTPSIKEGMSPKDEKTNRTKGVNLIDSIGQKLRLHQVTIATAAMFFHRFYMRCTMQRFHHYV
jgi:protein BUR2